MILDKRRNFSNKTKAALILKANNKCQFCKKPIQNINDIEFNHNHPHALGGLSNVNNGDVFHKSCNRRLGKNFPELSHIKLRDWQKKAVALLIMKIEKNGDYNDEK